MTTKPLNEMTQTELLSLREELVSRGRADLLPTEDLETLCAVFARLRQQSSGPPKERKTGKVVLDPSAIPG